MTSGDWDCNDGLLLSLLLLVFVTACRTVVGDVVVLLLVDDDVAVDSETVDDWNGDL
jgi:hypothetical protein